MRITKVIVSAAAIVVFLPVEGRAQGLAGLITGLLDQATINAPSPNPTNPNAIIRHEPHFIVGESLKLTTREVALAIGSQLASFPLPSSSGGFTFTRNEQGEVAPTSSNFGPSFAERGVTIGREKFNFGFTFQATSFSSFEGIDLDSGAISFIREHNDCCPAGAGSPGNVTNFNPAFERDLLSSDLVADISTKTTAFFLNYGVTDRFDIGAAIPFVSVDIEATVVGEILRTASFANPVTHSFDGAGQSIKSFAGAGSASGLGDVLLRAKYNFLRTETSALAAALDLRLPTGNEDDLLGTGATQTKLLFIASGEYGRYSPHVNFGYTFSDGEASEDSTNFVLDPAKYGLDSISNVSFSPAAVDLTVQDEVNYTAGISVAATPKFTVGFDFLGRTIRNVPRFTLQDVTYQNRGPNLEPVLVQDEFVVESTAGNLNLLLGVVGGKINVGRTLILNITVLFPLNDSGLKPNVTPVIGFDYVF